MIKPYYSVSEAAGKLGLKEGTLRSYLSRNLIRGEKVGHNVRIPLGELERYQQDRGTPGWKPGTRQYIDESEMPQTEVQLVIWVPEEVIKESENIIYNSEFTYSAIYRLGLKAAMERIENAFKDDGIKSIPDNKGKYIF